MTRIYDTIDVAHLVVVTYDEDSFTESSSDPGAARYRAECSCGWAGEWHDDAAMAEADGDDHREVVIGPGDELDELMSDLLDLQDHLAQAVMWLAEHWSADLPVPKVRGKVREPAGIELSAYCTDADVLSRAADLLRVPVVDDPAPDLRGCRYRRAVRSFGSVTLELFRTIDSPSDINGAAA
jgi:hypothetical protein